MKKKISKLSLATISISLSLSSIQAHAADIVLLPIEMSRNSSFAATSAMTQAWADTPAFDMWDVGWVSLQYIVLMPFCLLDKKQNTLTVDEKNLLAQGYSELEVQDYKMDLMKLQVATQGHKLNLKSKMEVTNWLSEQNLSPITKDLMVF
jgi:hypothetical protein